ncbi:receptor-like protein 43 [Ziziphus jujuba]|uniref:Receptor-like protein 43 n=1 Tax=Ziziphus jujuba TaxID=326968 RepID=A0ABM3ZS19_ZIZJJ|nr:receptor-like protein 43 [Ziziphus jujuba]
MAMTQLGQKGVRNNPVQVRGSEEKFLCLGDKMDAEKKALVKFKEGVTDPSGRLSSWLDKLDIAYNQLSGRVPNSFRFNKECTIELTTNRFQGPLPLWSSNITMLYLGDNQFSGPIPPNIGEVIPWLSDLDVADNSLSGSIPLSIGNLTGLMTLGISNNELSGQIPHFWENKQSMYIVDMSNNSLSGTIPTTMSYLSFLQFLIYRKLPAWIGESMHDLLILRLQSNSFNGNIPHQFCGLSKLHIIDMSHNHLIGHIPHCIGNLNGLKSEGIEESQIPSSIGNFEWIETLDISMNQISGPIPLSMTCLTLLNHLNLSYNNLFEKIPTTNQFLTHQSTKEMPVSMEDPCQLNVLTMAKENQEVMKKTEMVMVEVNLRN